MRVLLALLMPVPTVLAQGFGAPTLEKIRDYGTIYVGYRESVVPFSYLVGDAAVGYSIDLCDRIVDAIKIEIGNPGLKVVHVPVSSTSRLLMLMTGVVDLECGATANTKIRQLSVDFSVTTFVSSVKAVVSKNAGIERIADLAGKVVVTTAGSTAERTVKTALARRSATASFKTAPTPDDSLTMLAAGQADAFVLDDVFLSGSMTAYSGADKLKLLDENLGFEHYGIALRQDDPAFKKLVDTTLVGIMKNGDLEKIYRRWFQSPIPPKNVNLQIPMSDMFKELLRNPSDKGV